MKFIVANIFNGKFNVLGKEIWSLKKGTKSKRSQNQGHQQKRHEGRILNINY